MPGVCAGGSARDCGRIINGSAFISLIPYGNSRILLIRGSVVKSNGGNLTIWKQF